MILGGPAFRLSPPTLFNYLLAEDLVHDGFDQVGTLASDEETDSQDDGGLDQLANQLEHD